MTRTIATLIFAAFLLQPFHSCGQDNGSTTGKPIVLGMQYTIHSGELGEDRLINIYLPESYKADDTAKYDVIYLLDGGTDEDFIHICGLVQFNSFPWIHRLRPTIVVGIVNTNRLRDMTYPTTIAGDKVKYPQSGGADKFIAFIGKELKPYIARNFHIRADGSTLIGESLGGLLATQILLQHPSLFNKYIIVSPSLWWDNGSLLNQPLPVGSYTTPTQVYIGVGKEGLTPGEHPRVMEVDANLLADKIKSVQSTAMQVYFDYLPGETHATIGHQAVFNAIKLFYGETGKY